MDHAASVKWDFAMILHATFLEFNRHINRSFLEIVPEPV